MENIKTLFSASYRPKVVLWIGITIIVAMCLFPPRADDNGSIVGYAFLFANAIRVPGDYSDDWAARQWFYCHIDLVRLVIQCAIVSLITGALLYTLNSKKVEGDGK